MRHGKKIKEKRKKGGGGKGKKDYTHQTKLDSVLEGETFPPWLGRPPWGSLSPKARPPSPTYIYGGFGADLRRLFHGSPTTYLHGFPLDRVSAELGRSPAEIRSPPTSGSPSRCRRTHLSIHLSCWIKKTEIIVELYVC